MVKAVILVGGPGKGTRFRPLSLEVAKPLFPLAGRAMIEHHIEACSKLNDMQEVRFSAPFCSLLLLSRSLSSPINVINNRHSLQVILIGSEAASEITPFVRDVCQYIYSYHPL